MPVYVQHAVLGQVPDVFNAEALWRSPGLALFSRRPLLRDLLERSPREQRGRAATRCFSHVTLVLPQDEVDDDRHLTRGARVRDLAATLAALHQKDFGDLLGNDEVRYDVVGAERLQPGQVEVRFGHAVYLPAPEEAVLYQVATSRDSAIWHSAGAIYQQQRLALLNAEQGGADWPFGPQGEASVLLINDGPDAPLEVQVRPKTALDCSFDAVGGYYVIRAKTAAPGETPARLLVKVTRIGAAAPKKTETPDPIQLKSAAVWKTRARVQAPDNPDATAFPLTQRPQDDAADATYAPLSQQQVSLVALALPRLSRYRETGAQALEIGFDGRLALAAADAPTVIRFAVDGDDALTAITAAGSEGIDAPAVFTPVDGASVRLCAVAPEMAERYRALLLLPPQGAPDAIGVAAGARFVFGRGAPMLAGLRVLDSPRFIHSIHDAEAGTQAAAASADRIGLSRRAFSFEATEGGYRIARLTPTQALYHLDEQLDFVAAIPGDAAYLLPPGHHLVAGHYVLRFDA
jgi:hypothetical protein